MSDINIQVTVCKNCWTAQSMLFHNFELDQVKPSTTCNICEHPCDVGNSKYDYFTHAYTGNVSLMQMIRILAKLER